jgi:hypothetical protein
LGVEMRKGDTAMALRKSYKTLVGQNLAPGAHNVYRGDVLMSWVAYSQINGTVWMGQGADKTEALADLALRMLGHDEEAWRLTPISQ